MGQGFKVFERETMMYGTWDFPARPRFGRGGWNGKAISRYHFTIYLNSYFRFTNIFCAVNSTTELYLDKFVHLRQANTKYGKAPHKPVLLLSIIELIENGFKYKYEILEKYLGLTACDTRY